MKEDGGEEGGLVSGGVMGKKTAWMIIVCNPFLLRPHQSLCICITSLSLNSSALEHTGLAYALISMATAGPSRGPDMWRPSRYLEPRHPDNEEVLEQAAYQAAVTRHGGDARTRRYKPRRTVDYMGPVLKWRQVSFARRQTICEAGADGSLAGEDKGDVRLLARYTS